MELEHLDVASRCLGQTLNAQERSNLEIGLLKRRATESTALSALRFWGRITGESGDYLIAVATLAATRDYPTKKFYFCTNSSPELQQFPDLNKAAIAAAAGMTTRLSGDPSLVLGDGMDNTGEPQNDDAPSAFTELDRLAYLVDEIDRAISVVPLEALVVSPMRHVIFNPSFHGLSWEQARRLSNYFHFREPETPEKKDALLGNSPDGALVRANDFLDPIAHDLSGTWAPITTDNTGRYVTLYHTIYPGALFFHEPGTASYGGVYFGDGRKNPDIAFML